MQDLTPEQVEIRRVCREFAANEIRPVSLAVDEADVEVPCEIWNKAAAIGLTSFMLPEELGGGGMTDCLTGCIVQEELSHGCAGIGNLITSNGFFAEPVLALGDEAQQRRWLAPLAGERPPLTALATTEPEAGSDAASIRTTARRDGDGYVISGQKSWISNGGVSGLRASCSRPSSPAAATAASPPSCSRAATRGCPGARRCARWASARSSTPSSSSTRCACRRTAASATRARASAA